MMVNDFIYYYEKGFRANKFNTSGVYINSNTRKFRITFSGSSKELSLEAMSAIKAPIGSALNGTTTTVQA